MIAEKHFDFRCNNTKALWWLLLCFVGIPLMMVLPRNTPFILFMAVLFVPIIVAFTILIKKVKIKEEITLTTDHLVSKRFGNAYFKDIESISTSVLLAKPNLKIQMSNGDRLRWVTISNKIGDPNYENLKAFFEAFSEAILAYSDPNQANNPDEETIKSKISTMDFTDTPDREAPNLKDQAGQFAGLSHEGHDDKETGVASVSETRADNDNTGKARLREDIQSVKKSNNKIGKVAIPFGLALALLMFAKTYFGDKIKEHKRREIANIFQGSRDYNEDLKEKTREFIPKYQKEKGPFFFLTNDTTAVLHYLPKIVTPDNYDGPLSYVFESDSLKKLLNSPDSMQWYMVVQTGSGEVYPLTKTLLNSNDSTDTYVYFSEVVQEIKQPNPDYYDKQQTPDAPDSLPTQLTFVVPLYPNNSIEKDLEQGMLGYKMFLSLLTHHPRTTKFYMAARQGEGRMDEALFEKITETIKSDLQKQGAADDILKYKNDY